jgi:hypothetical protein
MKFQGVLDKTDNIDFAFSMYFCYVPCSLSLYKNMFNKIP